jgi:hypothetical protein
MPSKSVKPAKRQKPVEPAESKSLRKSIHVFDLDDTLMQTDAKVRVRAEGPEGSLGKDLHVLTPAEFTSYVLRPGESFDFRDFSDVGILSRGIVLKYTRSIIETIVGHGTQSDFGILTARGNKSLHAAFLIRLFAGLFGIRLKNSLIFALSDERFIRHMEKSEGLKSSGNRAFPELFRGRRYTELRIPEKKALVIARDLVARGYNDISLYDDSRENLEAFKVIGQAFPRVSYKPHFIDPTWNMRLEEFRASSASRKPLTRGRDSALLLLEHHSVFRENPDAGLRTLEAEGAVPLEGFRTRLKASPRILLCKEGNRFSLEKRD